MQPPRRIIVGISGASGAIYGIRLLQALRAMQDIETHLIISRTAQITIAHETELTLAEVHKLAHTVHSTADLAACVSSGSYPTLGMAVAPCSMRSLAEIALGLTSTLLTRAADVCLKERRRLVLLPRETPLNASHIKNMLAVAEMGGVLLPPVPAFYNRPQTIEQLVDHTVGRTLDLLGLPHRLLAPWEGLKHENA